jgi:hypothetical protein
MRWWANKTESVELAIESSFSYVIRIGSGAWVVCLKAPTELSPRTFHLRVESLLLRVWGVPAEVKLSTQVRVRRKWKWGELNSLNTIQVCLALRYIVNVTVWWCAGDISSVYVTVQMYLYRNICIYVSYVYPIQSQSIWYRYSRCPTTLLSYF